MAASPVPEVPFGDVGGEHVDAYLGQGLVFRCATYVQLCKGARFQQPTRADWLINSLCLMSKGMLPSL